jgi:hypothetical protein
MKNDLIVIYLLVMTDSFQELQSFGYFMLLFVLLFCLFSFSLLVKFLCLHIYFLNIICGISVIFLSVPYQRELYRIKFNNLCLTRQNITAHSLWKTG